MRSLRLDVTWLSGVAMAAEACRVCGTPEQAETMHRALQPYATRNVVAGPLFCMGPVAYDLGTLAAVAGREDDAAAHLAQALDAAARESGAAGVAAPRGRRLDARARRADDPRDGRPRAALPRTATGRAGTRVPRPRPAGADAGGVLRAELAAASGDLGPVLDARAKRELRDRVAALREREETAERDGDPQTARLARQEIERIAEELSRAMGLAGRDRTTGAVAECARASVTKAIRAAPRSA